MTKSNPFTWPARPFFLFRNARERSISHQKTGCWIYLTHSCTQLTTERSIYSFRPKQRTGCTGLAKESKPSRNAFDTTLSSMVTRSKSNFLAQFQMTFFALRLSVEINNSFKLTCEQSVEVPLKVRRCAYAPQRGLTREVQHPVIRDGIPSEGSESQSLSGSHIQFTGDFVAFCLSDFAHAHSFGEILSKQSVEVFVGAPLPRVIQGSEVALDGVNLLDDLVIMKLCAVVKRDRLEALSGAPRWPSWPPR